MLACTDVKKMCKVFVFIKYWYVRSYQVHWTLTNIDQVFNSWFNYYIELNFFSSKFCFSHATHVFWFIYSLFMENNANFYIEFDKNKVRRSLDCRPQRLGISSNFSVILYPISTQRQLFYTALHIYVCRYIPTYPFICKKQ